MTESELRERLAAPFAESEVKWRVQQTGQGARGPWVSVLAYIDNAAVMKRLDDVCGVGGWENRFEQFEGGVICGLAIKVGERWTTKWDGSAATQTEPFKGALSGAMKRAAVLWGIGRYLHGMGTQYAEIAKGDDRSARPIKGQDFRWKPPKLDARYLPSAPRSEQIVAKRAERAAPMAETVAAVAGVTAAAIFDHPLKRGGVTWREVPLPGTRANLNGFGGRTLGEVPVRELPPIRAKLAEHPGYENIVAAIDYGLAEELGNGN